MPHDAYIVALTGGIASGKSAAAARFAECGATIIDTDLISRELMAPGGDAFDAIVHAFGHDVLDARGAIDRAALRQRVFADEKARHVLENLVHPRIRAAALERTHHIDGPYAVLVIPLLVESGHYTWVSRVLVIDMPRALQRERLLARDHVTPQLADAMLDAQASRAQRLEMADDVIVNTGTLAELHAEVERLHIRYCELAREHGAHRSR